MTGIARDLPTGLVEKAYGRWANVYDQLCKRLFQPAHVGAAEAANRVGGHILEVGVGTGLVLPRYGSHVRVTGVDLSEAMLAKARKRVLQQHLQHVVALDVADVHVMSHPDASYDAIVLPFVLTLVSSPETALDNCFRMLRPGGEIIIVSHFRSQNRWIAAFETALAPLIAGIGLRPDFPVARVADWCAAQSGCSFGEPERLGALNVYTLLRIVKTQARRD
jgi:phosphatidylethanolamine/phosphatidyl-N-methylethanolamine N-methyltransferase